MMIGNVTVYYICQRNLLLDFDQIIIPYLSSLIVFMFSNYIIVILAYAGIISRQSEQIACRESMTGDTIYNILLYRDLRSQNE